MADPSPHADTGSPLWVKVSGTIALALGILVVVVLLTGTAGEHGPARHSASGGAETVIEITADDYEFLPNEVAIPAGQTVTLKLRNVTKQAHDLEVRGLQVGMTGDHRAPQGHVGASPGTLALHAEKGKTVSATFKAEQAGTYELWCTISGHKEQGMVGKLVVTPASATDRSLRQP